jgi:hypothetical protein
MGVSRSTRPAPADSPAAEPASLLLAAMSVYAAAAATANALLRAEDAEAEHVAAVPAIGRSAS